MIAAADRLKLDIVTERQKRATDVGTERQQKAAAKAKADNLALELTTVRHSVYQAFESRFNQKLNDLLMQEKEDRMQALKVEREERVRALKAQGDVHAKREDELAQELKELSVALTCAVLKDVRLELSNSPSHL